MTNRFKFRLWDKEKNKYFNQTTDYIDKFLGDMYLKENGTLVYVARGGSVQGGYFIDRFIKEFSTGLKDKNGKEMFEGDIVQNKTHFKDKIWDIRWTNNGEYCGFMLHDLDEIKYFISWKGIEIIGNIHQNTELLE